MKYGYIRVSLCGSGQSEQLKLLTSQGISKQRIYIDQSDEISENGTSFGQLLAVLQPNDVLAVTTVDRIADSTKQLVELCDFLLARDIFVEVLDLGLIDKSGRGQLILKTLKKVALMEKIEYRERSLAGKKRAKMLNSNYHEGRPPALITEEKRQAYLLLRDFTYQQVAQKTGFSVSTLKRIKKKIENKL